MVTRYKFIKGLPSSPGICLQAGAKFERQASRSSIKAENSLKVTGQAGTAFLLGHEMTLGPLGQGASGLDASLGADRDQGASCQRDKLAWRSCWGINRLGASRLKSKLARCSVHAP